MVMEARAKDVCTITADTIGPFVQFEDAPSIVRCLEALQRLPGFQSAAVVFQNSRSSTPPVANDLASVDAIQFKVFAQSKSSGNPISPIVFAKKALAQFPALTHTTFSSGAMGCWTEAGRTVAVARIEDPTKDAYLILVLDAGKGNA
jgi:hypothetical protein